MDEFANRYLTILKAACEKGVISQGQYLREKQDVLRISKNKGDKYDKYEDYMTSFKRMEQMLENKKTSPSPPPRPVSPSSEHVPAASVTKYRPYQQLNDGYTGEVYTPGYKPYRF